ncbi:hypothetical protein DM01DRAFT_263197 [Hesseltinella vesiculosa]|uniref:Nucleotide-diphospho-sugar transferase n=1 Tax=Hesseltinella vesiculosa TaxID=101127 RepID=A0A1X2GC78_9FUNG|nr:hypothetical protein DM01DRAFT_263197 [Hesseltinella vesiculosa]
MFLVTSVDHAKVLFPLLCRFPDTVPVHVVLAGESAGLQGAYWSPLLAQECRRPFVVHDLDLEMVSLTAQLTSRLGRLVHAIQPTVFLHLEDSPYFDHVQAVVKSPGLLSPCTAIHLPSDQVAHALWLANLPIAALQHWNKIKVELVVITDRRPHSLSRLLSSLREAKYLGDRVDLAIHMDQTADKVTRMLVHSFRWIHGNTDLRHRIRKGGLMPAIVESWFPSSNDHYGVLLEDDIEVSPLFYVWIKYNILHYRYDPLFSNGRSWIYGISLYSPRNLELKPQGRVAFDPNDELLPSGYPARSPYASQVPCSWGAVYFPEHWREFHQYLTARLQDLDSPVPQLNTTVPQSRSNRWKKSWKKYFIELVYLRGYVMVYPNFQDFESFSTNHLEFGTHIKHTRAKSAVASFVVPLMRNDTIFSQLPDNRLPFFVELPMIDLWGNLRTHPQLYHTGVQWQRHVSACAPPSFIRFDPQDLLCPFDPPANAMASLTLDPLPMTMTNQQPTDVQSLPPPPTATVTAQRKPTKKKKVLTTQILEHMEFVTVYVDDDEASHVTDMDNAWDDQPVALDVAKMAGSMSDHFYEDDEFKDLEHSLAELAALANA